MNALSEGESSSFLDPNRKYYVMNLREKWYDVRRGEKEYYKIYDEHGTTIGRIRTEAGGWTWIWNVKFSILVEDTAGVRIITVEEKRGVWQSNKYEIYDNEGNMLYLYHHSSEEPLVEHATGYAWLGGSWGRVNIEISDTRQKRKVAEFCRTKKWKDLLPAELLKRDTYALHILDPSYDKRVLIGFVIAYVYDYYHRSAD